MCAALLLSLPNRHTLLPEALGHALQTPGSHSRSCQQRSRSSRPPWCAAPARRSLRRSPWRAEGAAVCPQVVSIFAAVGVLFVPVGAVCLAEALSVRLHLICERRGLHLLIPTDSAPPLRRWWRWSSGMTTRARAARRRRCARPRCSRCALPRRLIERALRAGAPGCRGARGGEALGAARQAQGEGTVCQLTLTVPARMRAPVYLYYELDNFYQNHRRRVPHCPSLRTSVLRVGTVRACAQAGGARRLPRLPHRYVRSRSDAQLRGGDPAPGALASCDPQLFQGGNASLVIEPCGLVAWSLFNDTFQARPRLLPSACPWAVCSMDHCYGTCVVR